MDDQELLMRRITEETYEVDDFSETPVNLVNYFEKRLNEVDYLSLEKYLKNEDILSTILFYQENSKCYRVTLGGTEIDFPSNWSIFSKLNFDQFAFVRSTNDHDYLCEIFLSLAGEVQILVIGKDDNNFRLIFLCSKNSEKHLEWIENYLLKQIPKEEKKAA